MFIFLPATTKRFICITNKQTEDRSTPANDNRLTGTYSYHNLGFQLSSSHITDEGDIAEMLLF